MYVIIAGVGIIGRQITKMLVENRHDVVAIDRDPDVCESVYAETGALTIQGNATDINTLEKAGAAKADVIVCLMPGAADNIACALLSKSLGIPRIVVRLRNPRYEEAYIQAGATSLIRVSHLLVNRIMTEVEQPKVRRIITLGGGEAEIYAAKIPEKARSAGMKITEIAQKRNFPKDCLFIGIYREESGEFLIPRGGSTLQEGDTVFLLTKSQYIKRATEFLARTK